MRFLLVEDSSRLQELLAARIRCAGWRLDPVGTIAEAMQAVRTVDYDLILIDLGLPDGEGTILIRDLRLRNERSPILVLSARGSIEDRIGALDCGADDYLIKPVNHVELLARCRALLRRSVPHLDADIGLGGIVFDTRTGVVQVAGAILPL